ncbi:MAG: HAMP domain-containing protein [Alphaproteobacteria bacterium]|nr:HAMP domain-containing protein [Alphaproteobacteria bacterium]
MKLWPRTLGVQLIVVTAASVLVTNIAAALYFQLGNDRLSAADQNDRLVDRAASTSAILATVPAKQREEAAHRLGTGLWQLQLLHGKSAQAAMNDEESALAQRLRAALPPDKSKQPISVHIAHDAQAPQQGTRLGNRVLQSGGTLITLDLPVVRNTHLHATFYRQPPPSWPTEFTVAAAMAILVASAASAYLARRVARPLSALASAARAVAQGGTAPPVPEEGPDDVRNAARAFNTMTNRVAQTLESQRQLLSAVGHDLRTPITAMRINLEFVEDRELRERLSTNLTELQALTESVLSAARGTGGETKRNIDLTALVESLCADLDDLGEPVTWHAHKPAPLACRPDEIRRAVRNLVENAVAYGHRAKVQIQETPAAYEIVVEDEGPGIPDEDQGRVFEPFVRLETSRNSETGGTGLGLTLVKAIAQGHGGGVTLENREEGGLRARLTLPRESVAAMAAQ